MITKSAKWHCNSCGNNTNNPRYKGSGGIEVILYICFFIPGIIYSIWRRTGIATACPKCRRETLLETSIIQERVITDEVECPWCAEYIKSKALVCKHCGRDVPLIKKNEIDDDDYSHLDIKVPFELSPPKQIDNIFIISVLLLPIVFSWKTLTEEKYENDRPFAFIWLVIWCISIIVYLN